MKGPLVNNLDQDPDPVLALLSGETPIVLQERRRDGFQRSAHDQLPDALLFPGAFNPLHHGHRSMAELAAAKLRKTVVFEISVKNVDKPPLARPKLERRAAQFEDLTLCFTTAATFLEKSLLFPNATFLVGVDTIARIGQPRYYPRNGDEAFAILAERNCRFLVFGRLMEEQFKTLEAIDIPEQLRQLCESLTEAEFRSDISSTQLRASSVTMNDDSDESHEAD